MFCVVHIQMHCNESNVQLIPLSQHIGPLLAEMKCSPLRVHSDMVQYDKTYPNMKSETLQTTASHHNDCTFQGLCLLSAPIPTYSNVHFMFALIVYLYFRERLLKIFGIFLDMMLMDYWNWTQAAFFFITAFFLLMMNNLIVA